MSAAQRKVTDRAEPHCTNGEDEPQSEITWRQDALANPAILKLEMEGFVSMKVDLPFLTVAHTVLLISPGLPVHPT